MPESMDESRIEEEEMSDELPVIDFKLYENPQYKCLLRSGASRIKWMDYSGSVAKSELDVALSYIRDLEAELEKERKLRQRTESACREMEGELEEERRVREEVKELCLRLSETLEREREETERVRREIDEERRMLRVAEVLREERVHMKLTEANILFEEKIREISTRASSTSPSRSKHRTSAAAAASEGSGSGSSSARSSPQHQRKEKEEVENPHIRRGVHKPSSKATRARIRSGAAAIGNAEKKQGTIAGDSGGIKEKEKKKSSSSSMVECQMAQLKILTKHKNQAGMVMVSGGTENFVM